MMVASYFLGQKYYPVPYAVKKLIAYLVLAVVVYLLHWGLVSTINHSLWFSILTGLILLAGFAWFVGKVEIKELKHMPVIGKYFRAAAPPSL